MSEETGEPYGEPWVHFDTPIPPQPFSGEKQTWVARKLPDGWVAWYRFVPQGGQPVLAEVRVFHSEERRRVNPNKNQSKATLQELRTNPPTQLPPGGLTRRLLRDVPTVLLGKQLRALFKKVSEEIGPDVFSATGTLGELGYTPTSLTEPKKGRRPDELLLAQRAKVYADAVRRGSRRPVKEVAEEFCISPKTANDSIDRARNDYGLLTPSPRAGVPGGQLTPKAKQILKQGERGRK